MSDHDDRPPPPEHPCQHPRAVDINTHGDTARLRGKARVHYCPDCGERFEVAV